MIPRHIGDFTLRHATADDRAACYVVCLGTGDSGRDATHLHADPDALGHVYVGAYLSFEPEFALVIEDAAGVCGYALAAFDTKAFHRRYVDEWLPPLRARHPAPSGPASAWSRDEQLWNLYHHPELFVPEPYANYPSHLHIDLLPRAQGRGLGRAMMTELLGLLATRGSPGVHLAMAHDNHRAAAFYAELGFTEIARNPDTLFLARRLP
ncbi:MAG: GNAT family N-acetyltransferase [Opitutaceae bacterium]